MYGTTALIAKIQREMKQHAQIHTHTFQDGRCTFCGYPEGGYDEPHRACDASCMYHCTEGGQHAPSCDPLARRLESIERFGDAVVRWTMTVTFTLCGAAALAAYAAQYLAGK